MKTLQRKMLRDMWRMKGQLLAIVLVVAAGIATFVSTMGTYLSLHASQQAYYEHARFSDVFVHLSRAPEALRTRLAHIPGVATVQTRIVQAVSLDVPGAKEPVTARIVSVPAQGKPAQNALHLRWGRWPKPHATDEVLVNEGFAQAHRFSPGARISAVIHGKKLSMRVVGAATSPEFIYVIPPGQMMPNDEQFAVLWMRRDALAAAIDQVGAFNDAVFRLGRAANQQEVIRRIDWILEPYGGMGAYGRHRQTSHRYLSDEIESLRATGVMMPVIFLGIAAFLIHVLLSRLIQTQREQIATMLALGYRPNELAAHYGQLVAVVGLAGGAAGTGAGIWLGRSMTKMYTMYFHMPSMVYRLPPWLLVVSLTIAVAAAAVGVVGIIWRSVHTPPAEGMRPVAPAVYKQTILERIGLQRLLPLTARMVLRHLQRRPFRFALSVTGIAMAVSTLVVAWYFMDSMNTILAISFDATYRNDLEVTFQRPVPERARDELRALPGVWMVEGYRAVPVRISVGSRHRNILLMGLPMNSRLRRIVDGSGRAHEVYPGKLVLTDKLGEVLGVRPGESVEIKLQEGDRRKVRLQVHEWVAEPTGMFAYTTLETAQQLIRHESLSGAWLTVDPTAMDEVVRRLQRMPAVAGVIKHEAMVRSFQKTTKQYMEGFTQVLVLFALIIVIGVVYNDGRIALAERQRDLASLRVLGFRRGEVSWILLGELAVQVVVALPVGLGLGYGIAALTSAIYDTEMYRFPLTITSRTYALSALVLLVSSAATALVVRRKVDDLDMVEVLKTRE